MWRVGLAKHAPVEGPYRIATVAELTSVPEATLRAWERRYGIPSPERTASGYRLYGAAEVEQVREMRRLCEQGIAASEAAKVVRARSPLPEAAVEVVPDANADSYATMVGAMLVAIERFDDDGLEEQLRRLLVLGTPVQVLDRVISPVLAAIGERWHAGDLSVAHEHFATHKLGGVLRNLVRLSPGREARDCALFASFADDDHELGLLGFALRVSEWGARPIFLGARTPPSAIRNAVDALSPKLVALSVTLAPPRPRARELLDDYAAACQRVPWVVGGLGAATLAELITRTGGHVAPADPSELRVLVQRLLGKTRGATKTG